MHLTRLALAACLALPPSLAAGASAASSEAAAVVFRIPAGSLEEVLEALATQGGLQILYAPGLVARRQSDGLAGEALAPAEALVRIIQGSGLAAVPVGEGAYVLQPARTPQRRIPAARQVAGTSAPLVGMAAVQVTGSHIPRSDIDLVTPSPISVVTREDIEAGGYDSLLDVLRMQPGVLSHHAVDVAAEGRRGYQQPFASASGASLYGLGPRATLILVDGRRVANYGLVSSDLGGLVDLESIPLDRIERIEILRGGASAIYGADAMAGVVNLILRQRQEGGEFMLAHGVSGRGDASVVRLSGSHGRDTAGGGSVYLGFSWLQRDGLPGDARSWRGLDLGRHGLGDWRFRLGYRGADGELIAPFCAPARTGQVLPCVLDPPRESLLQPPMDRLTGFARWQRPLSDSLDVHMEVRAGRVVQQLRNAPFYARVTLPPDHPDALPGAVWLDYVFRDTGPIRSRSSNDALDVLAGLSGVRGEWDWRADLSHTRSKVDNRVEGLVRYTAFEQVLASGDYRFGRWDNVPEVLARIAPAVRSTGLSSISQAGVGAHGPLFELPGGRVRLALGLELQRDRLDHRPDPLILGNDLALGPQKTAVNSQRDGAATYAELTLPLHRRLQVELAARHDWREGYGGRTSPKLGVKWSVFDGLTLRGSQAGGFRAPSLFELRQPGVLEDVDLVIENEVTAPCRFPVRLLDGSRACLVTRGALDNPDLGPETSSSRTLGMVWSPVPAFSASLDHFSITRRNEVLSGSAFDSLDAFPRSLRRDAQGRLLSIDDYFANVGRTRIDGWDVELRHLLASEAAGRFAFRLGAQSLIRLRHEPWPGATPRDEAGVNLPRRTALGSVQWGMGAWSTQLALRYASGMQVRGLDGECPALNRQAGRCRSPARYRTDLGLAWVGPDGWRVGLAVRDLLERAPREYDPVLAGYDIAWDDPVGRYFQFDLRRQF